MVFSSRQPLPSSATSNDFIILRLYQHSHLSITTHSGHSPSSDNLGLSAQPANLSPLVCILAIIK